MKKIVVLLLVTLMSCSKDDSVVKFNELVGEWRWVSKTGGIAGVNETPKKEDMFLLILNSDNTYSYEQNGSKTSSGKYALGKEESMLFNKETPVITFDENGKMMYEISGNTLYLSEDYYDGFNYEYIRIK